MTPIAVGWWVIRLIVLSIVWMSFERDVAHGWQLVGGLFVGVALFYLAISILEERWISLKYYLKCVVGFKP